MIVYEVQSASNRNINEPGSQTLAPALSNFEVTGSPVPYICLTVCMLYGGSVRIKDLNLGSKPATVFVRGEYTKTKADRVVSLTEEVTQQLKSWVSYKYRKRRVCHDQDEKTVTEYRISSKEGTDLLFAVYQTKRKPNPDGLYDDIAKSFAKTLDRMGKGDREDGNEQRRQITLHSFRRFVKTTISDLGYADYSEYFIGHSGSINVW
jgi:hypothetical protein